MPSVEHEAPLEVIRQQPDVVADLLRRILPRLPLPTRVSGKAGKLAGLGGCQVFRWMPMWLQMGAGLR